MKSKRFKIITIICLFGFIMALGISYSASLGGTKDGQFKVNYDGTWKLVRDDVFTLKHKKTGSIIRILYKDIDNNYSDVDLKYLISDIMYSVEVQNKDYNLINISDDVNSNYQAYSYLYEKNKEQVLVNVYKKNTKIVIAYYEADSAVYDIVLDSVDTIFASLKIS